jgi:hypothetical protein
MKGHKGQEQEQEGQEQEQEQGKSASGQVPAAPHRTAKPSRR